MRVLHHPNIIKLLEVIETSSVLCLVLEMCPVDVLSHLCDEGVMAEPPPGRCAALKSSFKSSTPPSTQQLRCASIQPKKPEMGDKTRNG